MVLVMIIFYFQGYIFAKVEMAYKELSQLIPDLKKETNYAVHKFKWDKRHATYMFNRSVCYFYHL